MKIKSLFHVSFFVNDREKSLEFYRDKIGLEYMYTIPDRRDPSKPWITNLRIAKDQYLELIQASPDCLDKQFEEAKRYYDDTFYHMSLLVEDIEALAAKWYEKGIVMNYGPHSPETKILPPFEFPVARSRCKVGWIEDPDGNLIEVMEYLEDAWQKKFDEEHPID